MIMSKGVERGGGPSSNFIHQVCQQGGEWGLSFNFVHQVCHQGEGMGGLSARIFPEFWQVLSP